MTIIDKGELNIFSDLERVMETELNKVPSTTLEELWSKVSETEKAIRKELRATSNNEALNQNIQSKRDELVVAEKGLEKAKFEEINARLAFKKIESFQFEFLGERLTAIDKENFDIKAKKCETQLFKNIHEILLKTKVDLTERRNGLLKVLNQ